MSEIADFVLEDVHIGTMTGRFSSQTPNIENVSRSWEWWHECHDKFFSKRRTTQEIKDCDTCQYRFKCWTCRREERFHFIEGDFTQMHLRQLELYRKMVECNSVEVLAVKKKN